MISKLLSFRFNKLILLVSVIPVYFFFIEHFENQEIFDFSDEPYYIKMSHQQVEKVAPLLSVLPGKLEFYLWPPLPYGIYSFFANERLTRHYNESELLQDEEFRIERDKFLKRISYFHAALLCFSGYLIYLIANSIGLNENFSVIAAFLTVLNPRVCFYIQGIWPELIHFVLILSATYLFVSYFRGKNQLLLFFSSLLFGYCVFTKGIATYYYWFLIIILTISVRKLHRYRAAVIVLMFMVPYFSIVGLQKFVNLREHNTFSISTNTWVNIEVGLMPAKNLEEYKNVYARYDKASKDTVQRESKSRERVFEYIRNTSIRDVIIHQSNNYLRLLNRSMLKIGIARNRWKNTKYLEPLGVISVYLSWGLFVFGGIGAIIFSRQNTRTLIVAGFLFYYITALFVVGFHPRFFIQAIPFLSIFTALALQKLMSLLNCSRTDGSNYSLQPFGDRQ